MINNVKISAIIPTYNRKDKTLRAIRSVLDQGIQNMEIIVVDDGSTDDTYNFLSEQNLPIILLTKKNGGVSSARNFGIDNSTGQFIAFLDSDDVWLPNKLTKQIEFFKKNPDICLVYTDQYLNIDGKILKQTRFERSKPKSKLSLPAFVDHTPIHTSTVLIKKDILTQVGKFNETLIIHEDSELWNRISDHCEFGYIKEPLSTYYWESSKEHMTSEKNIVKFLENGKIYLDLYIKNKKRPLTTEEKIAVEESLKIIAKMEEKV